MENYKQEFIQFMIDSNVLKFGEFTLKSGRKSPRGMTRRFAMCFKSRKSKREIGALTHNM